MHDPVELFPNSVVFAAQPTEARGVYSPDSVHGHRWLKPRAQLLLRSSNMQKDDVSWLRLTMSGPFWTDGAWAVVRIGQKFSGVRLVREYCDHYFEMPHDLPDTGSEWVTLDIEVLNDCSGGPDARDLAICLHDVEIISRAKHSRDPESAVLRDQLAAIQGNPPFREILDVLSLRATPPLALEIGGGLGALGALVAALTSADVWCIDMQDYSFADKMPLSDRLRGILQRNEDLITNSLKISSNSLRTAESRVIYHTCSAENLPLRDNLFDLAFSLNAFEHIRNPQLALAEIRRTLKPRGFAFLQFSPIYFSDVGSHLYDQGLLDIPWAHLTRSRDEIKALVAAQGHSPHRVDEILDSLNGHPPKYYREVFANCGLEIRYLEEITGCGIPNAISHDEFKVTVEQFHRSDLLILGFKVLLQKP